MELNDEEAAAVAELAELTAGRGDLSWPKSPGSSRAPVKGSLRAAQAARQTTARKAIGRQYRR